MTTTVLYNGRLKNCTVEEHLDALCAVLSESTLNPSFAPFAENTTARPRVMRFYGNFQEVSHGFQIETDDQAVIDRLVAAINANTSTGKYTQARVAHETRMGLRTFGR